VIAHSASVAASLQGKDLRLLTENPGADREAETRLEEHAQTLRKTILEFHDDCKRVSDMGNGFFLPRRFLGNLDMLLETDVATGQSSAVLTRQELDAIERACNFNVSLFIKGSAGNGKTTVLSEIAGSTDGSVLVLPTGRLRDQALRSYPSINAVSVEDWLASIRPREWTVVTYPDFATEVESRMRYLSEEQLRDMWAKRFEVGWYGAWKTREGLTDEQDLYDHFKRLIATRNVDTLDRDAALLPDVGSMLIDEAQSMTPLVLKILALSSGRPDKVTVGLDSKQSVGKESAGRRTDVRTAIKAACDDMGINKYEHSSISLSINFRCPVGVLKVLEAVIQEWLKPYFKADFDDFTVDTAVRSSLWDSPPVLLCKDEASARRLLTTANQSFYVLHGPQGNLIDLSSCGPLLTLGLDDCRGLEFDELCVLDHPLSGCDPRFFRKLIKDERITEAEREKCRDTITTWLVLMTRCMFGAVWIEDPHHPVVRFGKRERPPSSS